MAGMDITLQNNSKTKKLYPRTFLRNVYMNDGVTPLTSVISGITTQSATSISVTIDDTTYIATINLLNEKGMIISSDSINLPIESMIVDCEYLDGVLTLTLQNGNSIEADISDIVSGLVSDKRTINGKSLDKDIVLNAYDVNALPSDTEYVSSINGKSGALDNIATLEDIPSKISQFDNDAKFVNEARVAEMIVGLDVNVDLSSYSKVGHIHTEYAPLSHTHSIYSLTDHTHADMATETFVKEEINKIPTPDVSGQINTHNSDTLAHQDIRDAIKNIDLSGYALTDHNHDEVYAPLTHNHNYSYYQKDIIDLSDTSIYDENKYYPCTSKIPVNGLYKLQVAVQLNSGTKPSWSTHDSGFTYNLSALLKANDWGVTNGTMLIFEDTYSHSSIKPGALTQLTNSGNAVLWLRGGGKYFVFKEWGENWSIHTETTEIYSQTITPVETLPASQGEKVSYENHTHDYLPLTAGEEKAITGNLYVKNSSGNGNIIVGNGSCLLGASTGNLAISPKAGGIIYLRPQGSTISTGALAIKNGVVYPAINNQVSLGDSSYTFNNIYGTTIYQDGKQVATLDDISIAGYDLEIVKDETNFKYTINLKDKVGNNLSSQTIDLPLESVVVNGSYSNGVLTLKLKNDEEISINISDIVSGLVPTTRKINGKPLTADIALTAADVEALPASTSFVSSIDGKSGALTGIAKIGDLPTITLNNSVTTTPSFYAPTGAGTNNYILKSNGSGAPSWVAQDTIAANTAKTLATSRSINGASFNGSANIVTDYSYNISFDRITATSIYYAIFASIASSNISSNYGASFIVSGVGNTSDKNGSYLVEVGGRSGTPFIRAQEIVSGSSSMQFGYYLSGTTYYFGVKCPSAHSKITITVLNKDGVTTGALSNTTTAPSGWTAGTLTKFLGSSATAVAATKATNDSDGNAINATYLKLNGSKAMTGDLILSNDKALAGKDTSGNVHDMMVYNTLNNIVIGNFDGAKIIMRGNVKPADSETNTYDLGSSAGKWKDIYASGTTYTGKIKLSSTEYPNISGSGTVSISSDGTWGESGGTYYFDKTAFRCAGADTQKIDLGSSTSQWKNIYLSGSVFEGGTALSYKYAKLSGGNTFTDVQHIKGTAASKPLWVRGIQGCLEDGGTEGELHLNFKSSQPVKWGYDAKSQLNSDGSIRLGSSSTSATNSATVSYDSTNKCLKFTFS